MTAPAVPATGNEAALSSPLILLLAMTCGLLIANLYFVQPIADLVAHDFNLDRARVGFLTTLPLAGYGAGLLFVVPLGDLVEIRRLILAMVALETVSLLVLSMVDNVWPFLATSFLAGLSATAIQVILPYTSQFLQVPHRERQWRSLSAA
jgi:MFS family permease